ncbi:NADP-dependent phosphogluconate dehydrogenase [candidate division KSB1 bacterium]|nr:NADP-dependent phosphogluconate dehydrogenase [candidate division KSB1 bacterium]NIR71149.1 NADP-dependent phosphogluconate dehydrogenase [candidate division KSB1 bacterium]NIS23279.1 NADP-dependent phosphogluconate dehydrogenase [candidate division KSB1 bacterium]NIT70157.1 NADP-dependent phosphogluconate dehydrogenase [candidate division KSB1 bacterium]NIU23809.1 NADP-dependent phosphogluconate dehydrogenase [candidate division KSB1 bacterium]
MQKQDFGLIGLGVIGQNFALNVEDNGFAVAVYDIKEETTKTFVQGKASEKNVRAAYLLEDFVDLLQRPRRIMLLVPAGKPVDEVIKQLAPHLDKDDLIIDGGNSYFLDTQRRASELEAQGINFFGIGVSGGAQGARWGPSLMPGGSEGAYNNVEPIMTAVAAKAEEDGEPCVTYLGPGGSGHFVKMVHNGIEYADMQLIAETYDLLKRTLDLSVQELHDIFAEWNQGDLSSFLIEITAKIFTKIDEETNKPLLDLILDTAGQKGTGRWTSQIALDLGSAIPTITAAVDSRIISSIKEERARASNILHGPQANNSGASKQELIDAARDALYASKICAYAQGMDLLQTASEEYNYDLNLAEIAKIWRAGCIIRAKLLNEIANAYNRNPKLSNLILDEKFETALQKSQDAWRFVIRTGIESGVPMPAMSASLAYYDAYRSERLPANLIQAQRDFFGAHQFERVDKPGVFHAQWDV